MGGEKIYLYGPCWAVEKVQTCVFSYGGEIIQQVNATVINTNEAYCVPDPFFLVGEVTITVLEAGDELANSPSTIYSISKYQMEFSVLCMKATDSVFTMQMNDHSSTPN